MFKTEFHLTNKNGVKVPGLNVLNKKFSYFSDYITVKTTIEDIYIQTKPYLDGYIKQYANYKLGKQKIADSIYKIILVYCDSCRKQNYKKNIRRMHKPY